MKKIVICTIKTWNIDQANQFAKAHKNEYVTEIVSEKECLTLAYLRQYKPDYVFFPHWSWIVPAEIHSQYECIVFHMTDLPYGRGGSPLQNLIVRNITDTKISALSMTAQVDAGPIYLKRDLNLNGTADEIMMRASNIIFTDMMPTIINDRLQSQEQQGPITQFIRRSPAGSKLEETFSMMQLYDHIRMLDGEGYPKAYLQFGGYRICFSRASLKNGKIIADAEIIEDNDEKENENE